MIPAEPMNLYGDKIVSTTGHHGVDIASQRMDDLDREALRFAVDADSERGAFLDLGCGRGTQGIRFAALGHQACLYDALDITGTIKTLSEVFPSAPGFVLCDLSRPESVTFPDAVQCVYSQRFLHYLPYAVSISLLKKIRQTCVSKAGLFVSASGIETELGTDYPAASLPVAERFAPLHAAVAEKHEIQAPVCLYSENDMHQLLLEAGYAPMKIWSSAFGNIKALAEVV